MHDWFPNSATTMINSNYILNEDINESNSLVDLLQHMDPDFEDEISVIDRSLYYDSDQYVTVTEHTHGTLSILNLNCGGLCAKFDKLRLFLESVSNHLSPISVITLQETHFSSNTYLPMFHIPGYNMIHDFARINSYGGLTIYLHESFSFSRLPIDNFHQNSPVYESIIIEIYRNNS